MAKRLQSIFGTEEDKVNCPFYFKIGACRHGDTCTRIHNKPPLSQTLCFKHMYQNPNAAIAFADGRNVPEQDLLDAIDHFEAYYEEVFMEMTKFGEIDEMVVADNIGDHMIGNVYLKYQDESQAEASMKGMNGRYYCDRMIMAEYSPVTDFREAKCRQYKEGTCERGGFCNFMHPKPVNRDLKKQLFKWMYDQFPSYREDRRRRREEEANERGRESPTEQRHRDRERRRSRSPHEAAGHHRRDRERERDRSERGGDRERRDERYRRGEEETHRDRDRERRRSEKGGDRERRQDRHRRGDDDQERRRRDRSRHERSPSRRHRSRSRDNSPGRSGAGGVPDSGMRMKRMTSEERRAMIAGWADEPDEVQPAVTTTEQKVESFTKQEAASVTEHISQKNIQGNPEQAPAKESAPQIQERNREDDAPEKIAH